jgi:pyruvate dehydrogenase E2 component (dihydrolipoamide acetyltransferase)
MIDFKLPSLGSDMEEGKLLEWKVKPGDAVKRGQVIAVVDTSKAAVEVEVWQDGTVQELITQPGDTIPIGTVMAKLLAPGEKPGEKAPVAPVAERKPSTARKPSSPAARRRAEELGIDIEKLAGSGPHGAVTLEDVERISQVKTAPAEKSAAPDRYAEMRKAIAAAMGRSKREIPHYYLSETVPMQRAAEWLAAENAKRPVTARLLMGALQLKAAALCLQKFPDLNGFWRDGAFRPSAAVHVGVAINLRQGGLIAPAIHDVPAKSLEELMKALADLVQRARAGSLRSSEMSDPTVTVTNLGDQGVEAVYGVIYPPQVALIGFGRLAERPWAENGALRAMPAVTASLAADHRVTDGHRGARYLAELRERLQHPETL